MRARVFSLVSLIVLCMVATPVYADMQEDIEQAAAIIERFQQLPESAIPSAVLRDARGLAILTMTKAGFVVSGRGGTGVVVAKTEQGWSGPSAIGTGGIGFGFQAGVQVSELVIVLNTPEAINAFSKGGNVTLGGNLSVAFGPRGRAAEAGIAPQAAIYTYSRNQGFFAGVSLEGTVIGTRHQVNEEYYGEPVPAEEVLNGKIKPPASAQKLLDVLTKY